jgi:Protein of unknown function (DUF2971)
VKAKRAPQHRRLKANPPCNLGEGWNSTLTLIFKALPERIRDILYTHTIKLDTQGNLAHFTPLPSLFTMLDDVEKHGERRRLIPLWLSDISSLNDPLEGQALTQFVTDHSAAATQISAPADADRARIEKILTRAEIDEIAGFCRWLAESRVADNFSTSSGKLRRVFICSFTRQADRLDLWRAYGRDGKGVCLVMKLDRAVRRLSTRSTEMPLYRVHYEDYQKAITWKQLYPVISPIWAAIRKSNSAAARTQEADFANQTLFRLLSNEMEILFHLYKHNQYRSEDEMRFAESYDLRDKHAYAPAGAPLFQRGIRVRNDISRVFSYSDPFLLGDSDSEIIIGPRVPNPDRLIITLEALCNRLWPGRTPRIRKSTVPYR